MSVQPDAELMRYLRDADQILIFTGAGVSTGSGIPDFRGPDGVWKTRQPVYYQDFMSSPASRVDYWDWKLEGFDHYRDAEPNGLHHAVVELERAGKILLVVTQNIDGLHGKAGTSPERLVELHGTNAAVECQSCGERSAPEPHFEHFRKTREPPVCACGGWLKSATISFGQPLGTEELQCAVEATEQADLVIALGSSLSVHPAASIPLAAAHRGTPYVIINRGSTDQDDLSVVSLRLDGDVVELFPPAVAEALGLSAQEVSS